MKQFVTRIERVLELMYSRVQQREAARQLGVSVSLLSATLSGSRRPSKTLVTALAKMPEVNERWLLDGIGEPLARGGRSVKKLNRPTAPGYFAGSWQFRSRISTDCHATERSPPEKILSGKSRVDCFRPISAPEIVNSPHASSKRQGQAARR